MSLHELYDTDATMYTQSCTMTIERLGDSSAAGVRIVPR
jgi:hypothetical protein